MGIPVLIIGRSGTGKSASLRNCVNDPSWGMVKVINKPLPFRGDIPTMVTDSYGDVIRAIVGSKVKSMVIDDAGYLITNYFMKNHSAGGGGNAIFSLYNTLADDFWNLIRTVQNIPDDKIVYIIMHEDTNDNGEVKPKTIGKLLDEKVCIEGMCTIVLRAVIDNGEHKFCTNYAEGAVSKSPMGMFNDLYIDNDLKMVDDTIREYYFGGNENV